MKSRVTKRFADRPIAQRITVLTSARSIIVIGILTAFAVFYSTRSLNTAARTDLDHIADNAINMCRLQEEETFDRLGGALVLAEQTVLTHGKFNDAPMGAPASQQGDAGKASGLKNGTQRQSLLDGMLHSTGTQLRIGQYDVAEMFVGNFRLTGDSTIVDSIHGRTGISCTIFQVEDKRWVRTATSIIEKNGERAIGTTIEADSPIYQQVMKGNTYVGPNTVLGERYLTLYQPIRDAANNIAAVIYVGRSLSEFEILRNALSGVKIGKSGYVYAINSAGLTTVHPEKIGLDLSKEDFTQKIIAGKRGFEQYQYQGKTAVASFRYFEPYDWYIVAKAYADEYQAPAAQMRNVMIVMMAIFVAIGIMSAYFFARSVVRPIHALIDRLKEIAHGEGDLTHRVEINSQDEMGELARWFNVFLETVQKIVGSVNAIAAGRYENLTMHQGLELGHVGASMDAMIADLKKRRDDAEQLRKDVSDMLKVASAASEGDFTVESHMSEGMVGILSDSFNVMLENISQLFNQITQASTNVSSTTHELMAANEQMAKGAESQALQISSTTSAIDEMSISIQSVAENADAAAQASQQAVTTATDGGKTVIDAIDAMKRIRETVQRTAQQIKALGESSLEISEIVKVINNIAGRTNLLALNATIEAAKAGEAGKGFAVVADEVRKLADQATKASNDIATLIQGIQSDMTQTISSMEKVTGEVETGSKLAMQAGGALDRIMQMAQQSAELIQDISLAAQQQAKASGGVVTAMNHISTISRETAAGATQAAQSSSTMITIAEELRSAISTFKLKED